MNKTKIKAVLFCIFSFSKNKYLKIHCIRIILLIIFMDLHWFWSTWDTSVYLNTYSKEHRMVWLYLVSIPWISCLHFRWLPASWSRSLNGLSRFNLILLSSIFISAWVTFLKYKSDNVSCLLEAFQQFVTLVIKCILLQHPMISILFSFPLYLTLLSK